MEPPSRSSLTLSWQMGNSHFVLCVASRDTETVMVLVGFQQLLVHGHQDWFGSVSDGTKLSHQDTIPLRKVALEGNHCGQSSWLGKGMPAVKPGGQRMRTWLGAVRKASLVSAGTLSPTVSILIIPFRQL